MKDTHGQSRKDIASGSIHVVLIIGVSHPKPDIQVASEASCWRFPMETEPNEDACYEAGNTDEQRSIVVRKCTNAD